ncbi:MAG: hypothetical protein ABJA69_12655 [Acidobacteriaceae bacterium]
MGTNAAVLDRQEECTQFETHFPVHAAMPTSVLAWDPSRFAEDQIRALVRQVFSQDSPKPARHVVFSAMQTGTDLASICMLAGEALSNYVSGSVCVITDEPGSSLTDKHFSQIASARDDVRDMEVLGKWRRLANNLWHTPDAVCGQAPGAASALLLRAKLTELRQNFDYAVIQGPSPAQPSELSHVGHLCDGIVLVLEAHVTRRIAAQRIKEKLHRADARLLGIILNSREFPVPSRLYGKL